MAELIHDSRRDTKDRFKELTETIQMLLRQSHTEQLDEHFGTLAKAWEHPGQKLLINGFLAFQRHNYLESVSFFDEACRILASDEFPPVDSPFSIAYVNAQLALSRRDRPITARSYQNFKANLKALKQSNPPLAKEVATASWPEDLILVDLWKGPHFISGSTKSILCLSENIATGFGNRIHTRDPIALGGIGTGQELIWCLEHQVDILYGMTRIHYVFESDPGKIRALLYMMDFSSELANRELVIFGGVGMMDQAIEFFGSMRYPVPNFSAGELEMVQQCIRQISDHLIGNTPLDRVRDYYQSEAFQQRQRRIASGEILPRVMVNTCRWTTFLKYCAADFEKAFRLLGCETRFLIEENDVQVMIPPFLWRELDTFRPDVMFMVSHARPSIPYLPAELPFICYMQDKCGPLLNLPALGEHINKNDLFVCMVRTFEDFLHDKAVPPSQTMLMPIPADETMFYPLESADEHLERFRMAVSFVKHGGPDAGIVFEKFKTNYISQFKDEKTQHIVKEVLFELYSATCSDLSTCRYEQQMQALVESRLQPGISEAFRHSMRQMVTLFNISVYSAAWRYQFLEALDKAGIELALYGNGWERHEQLKHLNRGSVGRDTDLNAVYNYTKINLSINQACTMHQRLSECGLAGGFIMVANHPVDKDWLPLGRYFDVGKEVVVFDHARDLVDKCRYYLAHEQERRDIADNLHRRCLAEQTCKRGARRILDAWRQLLSKSFEEYF